MASTPPPPLPRIDTEHSPLLPRKSVDLPPAAGTPSQAQTPSTVPIPGPGGPAVSKFKEAETPAVGDLPKAATNLSWGTPAGLHIRGPNDENLRIFRRALGINSDWTKSVSGGSLEEGRKTAVGIYGAVIREQKLKSAQHLALSILVYAAHFGQIVVGAVLTALGPDAGSHAIAITALGALNTVIAGVLALIKGQGLPERLRKDEMEFRKLQDWIEETEALLVVGVVGRDRREVGLLVEVAFKKYNAAKQSEENNLPENYVPQVPDKVLRGRSSEDGSQGTPSLSDRASSSH